MSCPLTTTRMSLQHDHWAFDCSVVDLVTWISLSRRPQSPAFRTANGQFCVATTQPECHKTVRSCGNSYGLGFSKTNPFRNHEQYDGHSRSPRPNVDLVCRPTYCPSDESSRMNLYSRDGDSVPIRGNDFEERTPRKRVHDEKRNVSQRTPAGREPDCHH